MGLGSFLFVLPRAHNVDRVCFRMMTKSEDARTINYIIS